MATRTTKTGKRSRSRQVSAIRNDILRALLNSEYKHLRPRLQRADLKAGEIIYRADQSIEYVYFPESAVVAMMDTMENGATVEVGIIGHEGMVGINMFLGHQVTPDKAVVQLPGTAMRMTADDLCKDIHFGSPLQRLLLRYTQALLAVISQSIGCSQHHSVTQRLARWLLTMHYYAEEHQVEMSQESIAAALGVRRGGVNKAAGEFQEKGLITYRRGHVRIVDELGLKKISCECYRFIRNEYESLLGDVPKYLSRKPLISS
jgi:CRP-like cAMP-binding protein